MRPNGVRLRLRRRAWALRSRSRAVTPRSFGRWHRRASVHGWLHVLGWLALSVVAAVVLGPWFAPLGVVVFEAVLAALVLRVRRYAGPAGRGSPGDGPGMGGVREPRRPLPTSGTGAAAALPL